MSDANYYRSMLQKGHITPAAVERAIKELETTLDDAKYFKKPEAEIKNLEDRIASLRQLLAEDYSAAVARGLDPAPPPSAPKAPKASEAPKDVTTAFDGTPFSPEQQGEVAKWLRWAKEGTMSKRTIRELLDDIQTKIEKTKDKDKIAKLHGDKFLMNHILIKGEFLTSKSWRRRNPDDQLQAAHRAAKADPTNDGLADRYFEMLLRVRGEKYDLTETASDIFEDEFCTCRAFIFPHRLKREGCYESKAGPFCGSCGKPCIAESKDFGIGAFEYWGSQETDSNIQTVSNCCDAPMFDDASLQYPHHESEPQEPDYGNYDDGDYRRNPKLTKHGKIIKIDGHPLKDATIEMIEENIIGIGPLGNIGTLFGFHPETRIVYFLEDPESRGKIRDAIQGKKGQKFAIFPQRSPIGGFRSTGGQKYGTLDAFWKNFPITKYIAGAAQYFIEGNQIVMTHMAVRSKWRRNRLNALMLDSIKDKYPDKVMVFHEPTDAGRKFIDYYGGDEYPE